MLDHNLLDKVFNNIIHNSDTNGIQTGFNDLDSILSNMEKGSVITVSGRHCIGKTSFMVSCLLNMVNTNKKCLYWSQEEIDTQLIKRFLVQLGEVDFCKINDVKSLNENDKQNLEKAKDKLKTLPITLLTNERDISQFEIMVKNTQPEFVFVDNLQDINILNQDKSLTCKTLKELKRIAKENNCIMFVSSKLNRNVENRTDKMPILSDFQDSTCIDKLSDVILFIYREEYYNLEDETQKNKAEIVIAKNNYGLNCVVELLFNSKIGKFCNKTV